MKILIIDNDEHILKALQKQLKKYELSIIKEFKNYAFLSAEFDLFIIDINLNGQNGLEIAKKIRQTKPNQKIIMITGYIDLFRYKIKEFEKYYNKLLVKPITKELLNISIKEICNVD